MGKSKSKHKKHRRNQKPTFLTDLRSAQSLRQAGKREQKLVAQAKEKEVQQSRLFIAHINFKSTAADVKHLLSRFGSVLHVHMIRDKSRPQSLLEQRHKGCALVTMASPEDARRVLAKCVGEQLHQCSSMMPNRVFFGSKPLCIKQASQSSNWPYHSQGQERLDLKRVSLGCLLPSVSPQAEEGDPVLIVEEALEVGVSGVDGLQMRLDPAKRQLSLCVLLSSPHPWVPAVNQTLRTAGIEWKDSAVNIHEMMANLSAGLGQLGQLGLGQLGASLFGSKGLSEAEDGAASKADNKESSEAGDCAASEEDSKESSEAGDCAANEEEPLDPSGPCLLEFTWRLKHLVGTMKLTGTRGGLSPGLAMTLSEPPQVVRVVRSQRAELAFEWSALDMQADTYDTEQFARVRLPDFTPANSLGRCCTYHLELSKSGRDTLTPELIGTFKRFHLLPGSVDKHEPWLPAVTTSLPSCQFSHSDIQKIQGLTAQRLQELPSFKMRYYLTCALAAHALNMYQLFYDAHNGNVKRAETTVWDILKQAPVVQGLQALVTLCNECAFSTKPASQMLDELLSLEPGLDPRTAPDSSGADEDGVLATVARVLITPTRVKPLLPDKEVSNRMVRAFLPADATTSSSSQQPGAVDLFSLLRVQLGEENGTNMMSMFHGGCETEAVMQSVRQRLVDGFQLSGRTYSFLVYSSSQLKEQSCWMIDSASLKPVRQRALQLLESGPPSVANTKLMSRVLAAKTPAQAIHAWMGDFSKIKVPAKTAARMGQALSSTVATISIPRNQIHTQADVTRNGYCFTDGVGDISTQLLDDVLSQYSKNQAGSRAYTSSKVTAIQVRLGGAKGVLSLDPALPGRQVVLRDSQIKFPGEHHNMLEVCNIAKRIPYYLNRQVILLLANGGVPDDVFLQKQAEMIKQLEDMMCDSRTALAVLPTLGGVADFCLNMLTCMLKAECRPDQEPVLHACLAAVGLQCLMLLRTKSRVLLPPDLGATLIGTADTSGQLEEDEVFLQVLVPGQDAWQVIEGPVLIAKHPVIHPGDVRLMHAVDVPELRHSKNEIKFSIRGDRPAPNMMSGSDLDGDIYNVTWDPSLLSHWKMNYPPQAYQAKPPEPVDEVKVHDIVDHFISHIINDRLGQICRAWEVRADQCLMGNYGGTTGAAPRDLIDDPVCTELALMASIAVDFPKTGVPAGMPPGCGAKTVPHWSENKRKSSYKSSTVIGQMYDEVVKWEQVAKEQDKLFKEKVDQTWYRAPARNPKLLPGSDPAQVVWTGLLDVRLFSPGYLTYLDFSSAMRREYNNRLDQLTSKYGVDNEGQLLTGCVLRLHKAYRRRQHTVREEIKLEVRPGVGHTVREEIKLEMDLLSRQLRLELFREVQRRQQGGRKQAGVVRPVMAAAGGGGTTAQAAPGASKDETDMRLLLAEVGTSSPEIRAAASALYFCTYASEASYDAAVSQARAAGLLSSADQDVDEELEGANDADEGGGSDDDDDDADNLRFVDSPYLGLPWLVAADVLSEMVTARAQA